MNSNNPAEIVYDRSRRTAAALSTAETQVPVCGRRFCLDIEHKLFYIFLHCKATLAQLVEQLTRNEQVVGSNPMGGSFF